MRSDALVRFVAIDQPQPRKNRSHLHRLDYGPIRHHPPLRNPLQDRTLIQACTSRHRRLRLSLLDEAHEALQPVTLRPSWMCRLGVLRIVATPVPASRLRSVSPLCPCETASRNFSLATGRALLSISRNSWSKGLTLAGGRVPSSLGERSRSSQILCVSTLCFFAGVVAEIKRKKN